MKKTLFAVVAALLAPTVFVSCGDDEDENLNNDQNNNQEQTGSGEENTPTIGDTNGVEYVDLGLPSGILWATMNIGADKIEGYGDLYSWGETSTKELYKSDYYSFYNRDESNEDNKGYTKYVLKDEADRYGFGGYSDDKLILDLTDDVAHVKLGGSWRMPTDENFDELIEYCDMEWSTYQGVNGYLLAAKNGKWLFLPAAGCNDVSNRRLDGDYGGYWSCSLSYDGTEYAYSLLISSRYCRVSESLRHLGFSVRAVCPQR